MKTFLPNKDPLKKYITPSSSLERLDDIAQQLPKLLLTGGELKHLPKFYQRLLPNPGFNYQIF